MLPDGTPGYDLVLWWRHSAGADMLRDALAVALVLLGFCACAALVRSLATGEPLKRCLVWALALAMFIPVAALLLAKHGQAGLAETRKLYARLGRKGDDDDGTG